MPHRRFRPVRGLALLLAAASLAACRDGNAPDESLRLALTSLVDYAPTVERTDDGTPYLQCIVRVTATPSGGHPGRWTGGTVRWYAGLDRRAPFDSVELNDAELNAALASRDAANGAFIFPGSPVSTQFYLGASVPFDVDFTLRYRDNTTTREGEATTRVRCGPEIPADAAPPAITALDAPVADPVIDFGDTLAVTYTATSGAMVWQSFVELSGPCEVVSEQVESLAATVTRTVKVVIPRDCRSDVPVTVTVGVLDGAGRSAARVLQTGKRVADGTPPLLTITGSRIPRSPYDGTPPRGTVFVGDTLGVTGYAVDNATGPLWLFWQVLPGGTRDSVLLGSYLGGYGLPVTAQWRTAQELLLSVRDAAGNESVPLRFALAGNLVVLPSVERPVRTWTYEGAIDDLVVDPRRDVLYLLSRRESRILVLDRPTMTVVRTIPTPEPARGLDITPSGDSLVFTLPGARSLAALDLRGSSSTSSVLAIPAIASLPSDQQPQGVVTMANGRALVIVMSELGGLGRLVEVNLADHTSRIVTEVTEVGSDGLLNYPILARSLDHGSAAVKTAGLLIRYASATSSFASTSIAEAPLFAPALDGTGARIAVSNRVYDASLTLVRAVQAPGGYTTHPGPTALTADGASLLYFSPWSVVRASTVDGALVERITVPITPTRVVAWPGSSRLVAMQVVIWPRTVIAIVE